MNQTHSQSEARTYSEAAVVLVPKAEKRPSTKGVELAKLNAEMDADMPRMKRLAKANTVRLTGKSHL